MHGEQRHLMEHASYALELGVPDARVVTNGNALKLAPGPVEIVGEVPVGRLGLDGKRLIALDDNVLADRRRMNFSGLALVSLGIDEDGALLDVPQVTLRGLACADEEEAIVESIAAEVTRLVERAQTRRRGSENLVGDVRGAVRRVCGRMIGKKPVTEVHVFRL